MNAGENFSIGVYWRKALFRKHFITVHQPFSMLSFRPFLIRRLTDEKSAGISSYNLFREILVAVPKRQKRDAT